MSHASTQATTTRSRFDEPSFDEPFNGPLLGLNPGLLLDDPDLQLGRDLGVQPDGHGVDAQRLDRILEDDLPLVDREAFLVQRLGDVRVGHRSVQRVALADLPDNRGRDGSDALWQVSRFRLSLELSALVYVPFRVDPLDVRRAVLV